MRIMEDFNIFTIFFSLVFVEESNAGYIVAP